MSWTLLLANLAPLFLGLGALATFSWFIDGLMGETYRPSVKSKENEEEESDTSSAISWRRGIVRLIGLLGIPFGILCLISLVSILFNQPHPFGDLLTLFLLAWMAIALFLTPISKLPWAALMGLVAGIIAVIAVTLIAPVIPGFILESISLKWILVIVFIVVGVFVFSLFKWAENILQLVCTILGSRPMLLILSFIAVAQAIALPVIFILFGAGGGILYFFIH